MQQQIVIAAVWSGLLAGFCGALAVGFVLVALATGSIPYPPIALAVAAVNVWSVDRFLYWWHRIAAPEGRPDRQSNSL